MATIAKMQCQGAEVFAVDKLQTPVVFHANRLKSVETKLSQGYALRVFHKGRVGFASTSKCNEFEQLVENAVDISQYGTLANYQFPSKKEFTAINVFDTETEIITVEKMIDIGSELIERIREFNSELLCDCRIVKSINHVYLVNSAGGFSQYKKTVLSVGIEGTLVAGTDMLFVMDSVVSCKPVLDTTSMVTHIVRQLNNAKLTSRVSNKRLPVVFTPQAVNTVLMGPLLSALNGKSVVRGISPFSTKLASKVMDSRITLKDDPTMPLIPGSRPSDAEGIPSQPVDLIQEGVLKNFLYDLQTAAYANSVSTGSAARSINELPYPAPGVLILSSGNRAYQELLKNVPEGIIVEQVIGAGQSNVEGGDFSGNVLLGYKFEKGEIVGRVKDTMISGNVHEVFNHLVDLSEEGRWIGGHLWAPFIMTDTVSVASSN